jgi:hypothetical protein
MAAIFPLLPPSNSRQWLIIFQDFFGMAIDNDYQFRYFDRALEKYLKNYFFLASGQFIS